MPGDRVSGWCERFAARHGGVSAHLDSDVVVLEAADGSWARLRPALPSVPAEATVSALLEALQPCRCVVVAVRRGGFACVVLDEATAQQRGQKAGNATSPPAARIVASKVSKRHVQGRTAAGGWSQQRFARRRDKQVHELLEAVITDTQRIVLPHLPARALLTAGDAPLVDQVLRDRRLSGLSGTPRGLHLASGDPDAGWVRSLPTLVTSAFVTVLDITTDPF